VRCYRLRRLLMTASDMQADRDQMRAEFAMSVRRLELGMEKLRERAMVRLAPADKRAAEVSRLQAELDMKAAQIETLRARAEVRKSVAKRIVKLVLYVSTRVRRNRPAVSAPPLFKFEQGLQWEFKKQPVQGGHASAATVSAGKTQPVQGGHASAATTTVAKTQPVQNGYASAAATTVAKTQPVQNDLAAAAAAIAAVNLKRRRAISNKV
jgi:hypothetical protein